MPAEVKFRIRELRLKRGWTQEDLASVMGSNKGFVSQLETGARSPSAATLADLACAFKVPAASLIESDYDELLEVCSHLSQEDIGVLARVARGLAAERLLREDQAASAQPIPGSLVTKSQ